MKKLMLTLAAAGLMCGAASAEWDFDIHGAEIARPRMALNQAQRATFLAGLELELAEPVTLAQVDRTQQGAQLLTRAFDHTAAIVMLEAAGR
ncbi:hypothetical protein JST97_23415 [bacterium]|nr:hypothetical protein [bacterium]